jgi:REP element-mobilizing transposase RayT
MARPLRIEFPGAFYHVTSRGDEKRDIYKSSRDRERFLEYLASAMERYGAVIHAYCLMTSHYHLLLETPLGNLSQIMQHINGAYTTYFNVKRKRAGHLFQGRFKGILVEADQYALEVSRYIHLNPVRAGMVKDPGNYAWSSYLAYIGKSPAPEWLTCRFIRELVGGKVGRLEERYREYVEALLGKEYQSPFDETVGSTILGTAEFIEQVMADHLYQEPERSDVPAVRALHHRFAIENITSKAYEKIPDPHLARLFAIRLCHLHSGAKLKEIGSYFGLSDSGVSKVSFRLKKQLEKCPELSQTMTTILFDLGRGKVHL